MNLVAPLIATNTVWLIVLGIVMVYKQRPIIPETVHVVERYKFPKLVRFTSQRAVSEMMLRGNRYAAEDLLINVLRQVQEELLDSIRPYIIIRSWDDHSTFSRVYRAEIGVLPDVEQ